MKKTFFLTVLAVLFIGGRTLYVFYFVPKPPVVTPFGIMSSVMLTFELIKKFNLPPDPGSANNDSIEGIVGKNLIRDDIERAIVAKYHKDPLKVKMLNIMSAIDTLIIRAAKAGDEPAYSKAMRDWSMITNCIMRSFEDQHLMLKWQRGITNNTDKRWEAEYARSSMGESVIEGAKYSEIMKHCERLKTQ